VGAVGVVGVAADIVGDTVTGIGGVVDGAVVVVVVGVVVATGCIVNPGVVPDPQLATYFSASCRLANP
jgi:hypothetical protein